MSVTQEKSGIQAHDPNISIGDKNMDTSSEHVESQLKVSGLGTDANPAGFATDINNISKGYYTSPQFLGSMLATGLSLLAGVGGYGFAAPILGIINADIGPDPSLIWVALVYTLMLAIGLLFVGRLTDIFGRRYMFIGGSTLSLVGCIVAATAQSIPVLIGAMTLIGLAASTQLSFHFTMGELVPIKYRFIGNSFLYMFTLPGAGFSPAVAEAFVVKTRAGWRGVYYLLIGVNALSLLCWILFYYPPTFHMKHGNSSKLRYVRHFDYVGAVLYAAGLLLFLMGLSWGGTVYPWKSAHVITTVVLGAICLIAFTLYECFVPLEEPMVPKHLFQNGPWVASITLLGIGASVYYGFAIIWPSQVAVVFPSENQITNGLTASVVGVGVISGQVVGGCLIQSIGKTKYQTMLTFTAGSILLACMATVTPGTKSRALGLLFAGCFLVGWTENICLSLSTIAINDQSEIGTAGGVAGAVRSAISTVAATVYSAVLTNRLTETIPEEVPPALVKAGLPASSVASFIKGITVGSFDNVPGVTDSIVTAGLQAYKQANMDAYRTVFYTTIAFSGIGILLSFFVPNVDDRMTGEIAATLHQRKKEKAVA